MPLIVKSIGRIAGSVSAISLFSTIFYYVIVRHFLGINLILFIISVLSLFFSYKASRLVKKWAS